MSGFGENDHHPMNPAPVVELFIYDDDGQPIDLTQTHYPPCLLQASLWSEDQTRQLDIVQIIRHKPGLLRVSPSTTTTTIRTMTGTLTSSPMVIQNHHHLGLYFSFPDIGFRVAETYCLRFDLVILTGSLPLAESVTHVYSDPFIVNASKD
ncbi:velvet factor [Chlamydoabsidia padenii]|nr:velvet factor [Chlamydoabsidia padenii]